VKNYLILTISFLFFGLGVIEIFGGGCGLLCDYLPLGKDESSLVGFAISFIGFFYLWKNNFFTKN